MADANKFRDLIAGKGSPSGRVGIKDSSDSRAAAMGSSRRGMQGKESGPSSVKDHSKEAALFNKMMKEMRRV